MELSFSQEAEREFFFSILGKVENYLQDNKKQGNNTGLLSQKRVLEEFEITHTTLRRWERLGLRRYTPPIEGSTNIYYKTEELLKFLGVE